MVSIRFFLLLFIAFQTVSVIAKVHELATKQAIENIRFISEDGKFTYYQSRSGKLLLAKNYKTQEVLSKGQGTQYFLSSTSEKDKMLVSIYSDLSRRNELKQAAEVGIIDYGKSTYTEHGNGIHPKLHLKDNWISYFDPDFKILYFKELVIGKRNFSIKLQNKINPWFIPEAQMLSEDKVLYTDLNVNGTAGLLLYDRVHKSVEVIYKSKFRGTKIELCQLKNKWIIAEFGLTSPSSGSWLKSFDPGQLFTNVKWKKIYESKQNDIGNILCDLKRHKVYFVQNQTPKGHSYTSISEVVELDPKTSKISTLTKFKTVSQIHHMDGRILVPQAGSYYVVKGSSNEKSDSLKPVNKDKKP